LAFKQGHATIINLWEIHFKFLVVVVEVMVGVVGVVGVVVVVVVGVMLLLVVVVVVVGGPLYLQKSVKFANLQNSFSATILIYYNVSL
jgi:hypothetical protein